MNNAVLLPSIHRSSRVERPSTMSAAAEVGPIESEEEEEEEGERQRRRQRRMRRPRVAINSVELLDDDDDEEGGGPDAGGGAPGQGGCTRGRAEGGFCSGLMTKMERWGRAEDAARGRFLPYFH